MRRHLLPVLLLPLALAHPASAATPGPGASVGMTLRAAGHSYDVSVLGFDGRAQVEVREVGTHDTAVHVGRAAAFAVTDDTATLRADLGGVPLRVDWTADPTTVAESGGSGKGSVGDSGVSHELGYVIAGHAGTAKVLLGDVTCVVDVFAIVGTALVDDAPSSSPLAGALRGIDLDGAACGNRGGTQSVP